MRKKVLLLSGLILTLGLISWGGVHFFSANGDPQAPARTIAVVPLDSRPCNTQYPLVLSQMGGFSLLLPPDDALDDFLTPAATCALWQWLETAAAQSDRLIIFTNTLFNGGLIHSRDSQSYDQTDAQLAQLSDFCQRHADKHITVVSILPRLKPSQFDDALWPYEEALTAWGQALDHAASAGEPEAAPPLDVPDNAAARYRALFAQSGLLASSLADMAEDGLIDQVVIGQDDAEALCPSNIIYRQLKTRENANLTLIHGADELTMLLVARAINPQPVPGVRLVYTNPDLADVVYPYEAAPLSDIIADKLAFAGLTADDAAARTIIIHNDPAASKEAAALIAQTPPAQYLGLVDIAYTNKGDPALASLLLTSATQDRLGCYAGWNTASNALGTVLAHALVSAHLAEEYPWLDSGHRTAALRALHQFKVIRASEDVIYQSLLSGELRADLQAWDWMLYTNAFRPGRRADAEQILAQRFAPYQAQLCALFNGEHQTELGGRSIRYSVSDFDVSLRFPWNRAFEVQADCTFTLTPERSLSARRHGAKTP